jgi:hypothetical protein
MPAPGLIQKADEGALRKFIQKQCNEFSAKSGSPEFKSRGYFRNNCVVELYSKRIVSVLVSFDAYDGAAATNDSWSSGYVSLKGVQGVQKPLSTKEIFLPKVNYPLVLAVLSAADLKKQGVSTDSLLNAVDFNELKEPSVVLAKDGLKVLYSPGILDAEAAGTFSASVSYELVKTLLRGSVTAALASSMRINENPEALSQKNLDRGLAIIAIGVLSEIISAEPENTRALLLRAAWYQKIGKTEVAEQDKAKAASLEGK